MQVFTHPGTFARLFPVLLAVSLLFCAMQLRADDEGLGENFWEKYDDIADWLTLRLKLTPEQENSALPILEQNFEKKKAMLKEYGFLSGDIPTLDQKQKEEIDAKMIAIRAETRAQLVSVLDERQLEELKKVQREYHEEFRRRLKQHTDDG
ncbi:hypothetical protein [Microbulbifer litoralis]|uniref:hypothetical protein n=1 Tax=Microbulbifer litoralis TaxID=2933965 RepID=UPI00202812EC|nr:hypothetical protein [Microbulbifer sp. GX H0434]